MKKRPEEELDEEFIDDEEFVDDEELLDDDFDDDDFLDDEEEEVYDEPKKKGKKVDKKKAGKGKKGKKKLSKGAKWGVALGVIAGVAALVVVAVFVVLPMVSKKSVVASEFQELLTVNGYQNYEATAANVKLKKGASDLISVQTMIDATGLDYKKSSDKTAFAAAIYSLAITNYEKVAGTGWYCYTDSSVFAKDVTAELGPLKPTFKNFNVGVRAAFGMGSLEADSPNEFQKSEKKDNFFSQTISGVTVLNIDGITPVITDALKTSFGYNCQEYLYNGTYAYKLGPNGGAEFYGNDDEYGYLYMMGAYNEELYKTKGYSDKPKDPDKGYKNYTFTTGEFSSKYAEVKALEKVDCPDDIEAGPEAWGSLEVDYDYAFKLTPYTKTYTYYYGNYGSGWATYNFSKEYLDDSTTVEYDKTNHVYTINYVVKESKMDDACMFAKGSLTKDTKDYIQLQEPVYSLSKNMIQIYDNGLIKYWERVETVQSELPAKLTVLKGECAGGGGTTNSTYMAFSYCPIDYHPQALAARYMSEIKVDSKWPTLANYDPKNEDYTKIK